MDFLFFYPTLDLFSVVLMSYTDVISTGGRYRMLECAAVEHYPMPLGLPWSLRSGIQNQNDLLETSSAVEGEPTITLSTLIMDDPSRI